MVYRQLKQRDRQKGTALVMVLSLVVVLLTFAVLSSEMINRSMHNTQDEFRKAAQASNIARAGLRDGIGWFKNQSALGGSVSKLGPYSASDCADAAFDPAFNTDPSLRETIDASTGLVKDLRLDPGRNIYGRYILRKQACKPAGGDYTLNDPEYDKLAVHDITDYRGKGLKGEGLAWHLVSQGIIYQRNNLTKDANGVFTTGPEDAPNRILDKATVEIDINRMNLAKPFAPITVTAPFNGTTIQSQFNTNCKVVGRNATSTVIYSSQGGGSNPSGNPECQYEDCSGGNDQKHDRIDGTDPMSIEEVFAVSKDEIRSVADYIYTSRDDLEAAHYQDSLGRSKLPMALYYLDGNFTFDNNHVLQGNGILFVDGNLTLNADSFTFTGVVYVTGQLTMKDNNEISGAAFGNRVICQPGTKASFEYNEGILETVRDTLALYRESTLSYTSR